MSELTYPFRSFPDECYRLEKGTDGSGPLKIQNLKPVNSDSWLKDEKERLHWQFRHLREFREVKAAAARMITNEDVITEEHPAEFHLFAKLPTEVRLKIYELSDGGYKRQRIHRINGRPDTPLEFMSNQPLSPLLHACAESRHESQADRIHFRLRDVRELLPRHFLLHRHQRTGGFPATGYILQLRGREADLEGCIETCAVPAREFLDSGEYEWFGGADDRLGGLEWVGGEVEVSGCGDPKG